MIWSPSPTLASNDHVRLVDGCARHHGDAADLGQSRHGQNSFVGDKVAVQLAANDPIGVPLVYSATGLPTGLSVSSTGLIAGTVASSVTPTPLSGHGNC